MHRSEAPIRSAGLADPALDVPPRHPGQAQAGGLGPMGRRLGGRGLSALGAVLLLMVVSVPAALVDVNLGGRLHILTAIAFIGTCALSAVLVRRCDLKAVVVMPPLMFVLLAGVSAVITGGGDLRTRALLLISTVVLGAPILMSATIVTAVVAGLRLALRRN